MLIGEGPGWKENKLGRPFVGKSGQELDETYLKLAGLDRSDVYVTNAVQCRCERNGVDFRPSEALTLACASNHLPQEIECVKPSVIVLLGATACSLAGKIDLELDHGFPRVGKVFNHECMIVPQYHPAAGLHETRFMTPMLEDWERFGMWLKGKWRAPQHEKNLSIYTLCQRPKDLPHISGAVAIDSETDEAKPYSVQFSFQPGKAYMVLAEDRHTLRELATRLRDQPAVFHNACFDLDLCDSLGIHVGDFRDTMQEIYHLGNLPQGLKAAVYRIFGYRMTSYDEVVTPWSKRVLDEWLACALAHASSDLRLIEPHPPGAGCPTCGKKHRLDVSKSKPHEAEAVLRRIMGKINEDGSDYDPWQQPKLQKGEVKPRLLGRDWLEEIEATVGRMPRKSIVHAPLDQQVAYGCSDADWTLRLAGWLEGERKRIVQEEWKVA